MPRCAPHRRKRCPGAADAGDCVNVRGIGNGSATGLKVYLIGNKT